MTANTRPIRPANIAPAHATGQPFLALGALLTIAVFVGGGGVGYGLFNLAVQLAALIALAVNFKAFGRFWGTAPQALRALVCCTLALPLLQLVPLPPSVWQALPGRELIVEAFQMAADRDGWFPLSVAPHRTLVAASGLIVPFAVLVLGWSVTRQDLPRLVMLIVLLGLVNFVWGIPQVLANGGAGILYPENAMPGVLFGGFANRNSTGIFLVCCLCFMAGMRWHDASSRTLFVRVTVAFVLVLAIILTRSRSAIVLAALPLLLMLIRTGSGWLADRRLIVLTAVAVAAIAALAAFAPQSRLSEAAARFAQTEDARERIWEDAQFAASRYWPVGSGMGTFDEVFQVDESLENLSPRRAGRAHNDYLEIAVEAGLPGLALAAVWLAFLVFLAWRARTSPDRWLGWSGATALLCLALQSMLDYPLRSQAVLALAAFALLVLARSAWQDDKDTA